MPGTGLFGLVGSLIGNVAAAKRREQAEDDAYWQRMATVMGAVMDNQQMPLPIQDQARQFYFETLTKHSGKEGKAAAEQMNEFLKKALPMRKQIAQRQQEDKQTQAMGAPDRTDLGLQTPQTQSYLPAFAGMSQQQPQPDQAQPTRGLMRPGQPIQWQPASAAGGGAAPGATTSATSATGAPGPPPRQRSLALRALAGLGGGLEEAFTGAPAHHPTRGYPGIPSPALYGAPVNQQQLQQRLLQQTRAREADQLRLTGDVRTRYILTGSLPSTYGAEPKASTTTPRTMPVMVDGKLETAREVVGANGQLEYYRANGERIDASRVGFASPKEAAAPKLAAALQTRVDVKKILADPAHQDPNDPVRQAALDEQKYLDIQAKTAATREQVQERQQMAGSEVVPGSNEFQVAQDLAYGKITFQQFHTIYPYSRYSRNEAKREAIYVKARELNPEFDPAEFELGYRFAMRPQTRQQLAALDNVQSGVDDLVRMSNEAARAGATFLNRWISRGGYAIGNQKFTTFAAARTAFADELSGALGFGSATDMSRQMGFDMTDPNLSPENFRHNIEAVVIPFMNRKRNSLLSQMGPYGEPERRRTGGGASSAPVATGGGGGGPATTTQQPDFIFNPRTGRLEPVKK